MVMTDNVYGSFWLLKIGFSLNPKTQKSLSLGYWGVKVWNAIVSIKINLDVSPYTFKNYLKRPRLNEALSFPVLV